MNGAKEQLAKAIGCEKLSNEQIQELKKTFMLFDRKNSGFVTVSDITAVFASLGFFLTPSEVKMILQEIDEVCDDKFSFDRFAEYMFTTNDDITREQEEKELKDAFKVFDRTNRGYITINDLKSVLKGLGEQLSEDELENMMKEVDKDGDGNIDFDEFVNALKAEKHAAEKDAKLAQGIN